MPQRPMRVRKLLMLDGRHMSFFAVVPVTRHAGSHTPMSFTRSKMPHAIMPHGDASLRHERHCCRHLVEVNATFYLYHES